MYQVGIRANPEHFLDWDKPLSEQHPKVQEALHKGGMLDQPDMQANKLINSLAQLKGDDLNSLRLDHSEASRRLREAGIPGIKYLDQGSRARPDPAFIKQRLAESQQELARAEKAGNKEEIAYHKQHVDQWQHKLDNPGTRNFVVFDDKLIDILKKYGIAGIGALPAMNAFHYQDKQ